MSTRALVIGLGTSGLRIIEECQQFHYQFRGCNKPDSVEYMFFETDLSKTSKTTALGESSIESCPMPLSHVKSGLSSLYENKNIDKSWLPSVEAAQATSDGAGGNSTYGRLALWINFDAVYNAIDQRYKRIQSNNADDQVYVFIVGTLTGGTCSGACVDFAYLSTLITGTERVYGLFLIPSQQDSDPTFLYNYYSSVSTIHYYSKDDTKYDVVYPNGKQYTDTVRPFKQCYFLSRDFAQTSANMTLKDVSALYKAAGMNLFARINGFGEVKPNGDSASNLSSKIDSRAVDVYSNLGNYKFSTFGTKLISYPKAMIKELYGIELSQKTLSDWIDTETFRIENTEQLISNKLVDIRKATEQATSEMIKSCFTPIQGVDIDAEVKVMLKKSNTDMRAYMLGLFVSNDATNIYSRVKNYKQNYKDLLVEKIHYYIQDELDKYQNLTISSYQLDYICDQIGDCIDFWESEYNITKATDAWDAILLKNIKRILDNKLLPTVLTLKKEYLLEQVTFLYSICVMQCVVEVLGQILESIKSGKPYMYKSTGGREKLPSKVTISEWKKLINSVLGKVSDDENVENLTKRASQIKSGFTNNANFVTLFDKESIEGEMQNLQTYYNQNFNTKEKRFKYDNITAGMPLYKYLSQSDAISLYAACLKNGVEFVNNSMQILNDIDVLQVIENLKNNKASKQWQDIKFYIEGNENEIRDALPGMLRLKSNLRLSAHEKAKLIYVHSEIEALKKCLKDYELNDETSCEVSGLKDAIIVYQEYGMANMDNVLDPITDIDKNTAIRKQIRDNINYDSEIVQGSDKKTFYFKRRIAYLTKGVFESYIKESL